MLESDESWERLEVRLLPTPELEAGAELTPVLNAFLSELELFTLGPDWSQTGWHELTHEEAVRTLTYLLSETMAYAQPKRERLHARECALAFLALFGPSRRLLSNSDLHTVLLPDGSPPKTGWGYGSGRALTPATFEGGIVVVGAGRIGLLWVTDED
ncbi:hypothetical protein [Hyalangium rubrum]|uniref:Uncharacterized protein n=1 Tax=Hyalangium rubrum TaxID=3103134 RepID=A0ABU5GUP4_9BACT|nr:hypothetical protein [Hyalangium sp. s54d21]MDY7224903.1 hypothetical protein [Hyalangium sp. s54d21]